MLPLKLKLQQRYPRAAPSRVSVSTRSLQHLELCNYWGVARSPAPVVRVAPASKACATALRKMMWEVDSHEYQAHPRSTARIRRS